MDAFWNTLWGVIIGAAISVTATYFVAKHYARKTADDIEEATVKMLKISNNIKTNNENSHIALANYINNRWGTGTMLLGYSEDGLRIEIHAQDSANASLSEKTEINL